MVGGIPSLICTSILVMAVYLGAGLVQTW